MDIRLSDEPLRKAGFRYAATRFRCHRSGPFLVSWIFSPTGHVRMFISSSPWDFTFLASFRMQHALLVQTNLHTDVECLRHECVERSSNDYRLAGKPPKSRTSWRISHPDQLRERRVHQWMCSRLMLRTPNTHGFSSHREYCQSAFVRAAMRVDFVILTSFS